ncbi:helix-turn-helix domain-containing protein [Teichococcus aestuarii]|uniref:helix-turn-helix domain-containing protein n=1 Tax=Teichococcus aestuarii TaxID=568898 RepID=UPI00361029A6
MGHRPARRRRGAEPARPAPAFPCRHRPEPRRRLLAERLARARELLETGRLPVQAVAEASGFATAAALRHHFRAALGSSPAAYRARFSR